MILHQDKEIFKTAINLTSSYFNTSVAIVEKDYYVTLVLSLLTKQIPDLIFKGGTSLSKCYKIIHRFSEDIDLTLNPMNLSTSKRKNLKYTIFDICNSIGLHLLNANETRSRRDYNCYRIDYPAIYNVVELNPQLLIETTFIVKSFPTEVKQASSLIYDYLKKIGNEEAIKKYQLEPFAICVQTLERTFIDKVFAICDYVLTQNIEKHSRHIYDLSQLLPMVKLDENFRSLVKEVREERNRNVKCLSAQDKIVVPKLLQDIIEKEYYKKDYQDSTEKLLTEKVTYNDAIEVIKTIIISGAFE